MAINRFKEVVEGCFDGGFNWQSSFRKVPAVASTQGIWSDLSMAPGNPKPNYYTGSELTSTYLDPVAGIYTGGDVSPKTKYLQRILIGSQSAGVVPATLMLLDYLLFYPLVDMDSTDEQTLVNSRALTRYTSGDGVRAMLVSTNPFVGGAQFSINYTNQDGVAGQMSVPNTSNTSTNIASLVTSNAGSGVGTFGPFIQLAQGDHGIRSVQSVTFYSPNGGLASLVLVKPLATLLLNEISAYCEFDFLTMKPSLPQIADGAVLGFIAAPNGTMAAAPINGEISVIYN